MTLTSRNSQRTAQILGLAIFLACIWVYPGCDPSIIDSDFAIIPASGEITVGQTLQLEVEEPFDELSTFEWTSSDEGIATVNALGLVTAISPGMATITVREFEFGEDPALLGSAEAVITVVPATTGGDDTIDIGVFPTCSSPEAVNLIDGCNLTGGAPDAFGSLSGGCLATVSCADGYRVLDLTTQETVLERDGLSNGVGAAFGTIGVEDGGNAALFTFGTNGNILCPTEEDGFCQFTINAPTFDATPAGGDPSTGEAVFVGPSRGVQFLAPVSGGLGIDFRKESIPSSAFDGELVSAWMPRTGGTAPLLVLTRAVNSSLYEVEGPTPNAFPLNLGLDARRIRCADVGNGSVFCGVSVFGDDRIAFVLWTITNSPQLRGFVDAGDGPVGLDIWRLSSGNFAVVSTGFNNNSITEMEVNASAANPLVSTQTRTVPAGCLNPGHAAYVEDGSGLKVVGTCFGSDNAFVEESRF